MNTPLATPQAATQRHPALELLSRHTAILRAAWAHRAELAGPARLADELAFLPAALSLQDTPVHPAPRRLAWGLMLLFAIALVWSIVGQVDIVAVAPGRIIVGERTKLIQPLQASVVRAVRVKDGDKVRAGQVLVELDPSSTSADKTSLQAQRQAQASELLRTRVLLSLLSKQELPTQILSAQTADLTHKSGWTPSEQSTVQAQLQAEWQDIRAQLAKFDAAAQRQHMEAATVQASIAKLQATLPMAQTREADFQALVGQGFISSHATQDKTRERVEQERDLATQRARLAEMQAALAETRQSQAAYRTQTLLGLNERQAQADSKYQQLQAEYAKAAHRDRLTQLTAPVDGVVQQLAIHSVGGVVTEAQALMVIVPDSASVTAEVSIANLDIGFVNAGQTAEVKLETFPYTQYGTVAATVDVVTADAVTDEKKGSYYPATITLAQTSMRIDGKRVHLSPGMNVTAEIKTGRRRIIEYLLSPVQRAGRESLRER